jgi:hypothetical protein
MRLILAFKAFLRVLSNPLVAERLLDSVPAAETVTPPVTAAPRRSEAIAVLAVLQREGRLIDFLQEPIDSYSDAQIGAAVRDIHRGSAKALARMFAPAPVRTEDEGAAITVESGYDAGCTRLTGQVSGEPPYSGVLCHPGWQATRCELPEWSGSEAAIRVIAPAEVDVKG